MAKRILIVEDDPIALELIEYTLQQEGYEILTAPNGVEGLAKARDERPDLVVLDVMLPGLDGFEVCHRLRAKPETAGLPVLMLSAKAREVDIETGQHVGADIYLTKPLDPSALVAQVGSLLEQQEPGCLKVGLLRSPCGRCSTSRIDFLAKRIDNTW